MEIKTFDTILTEICDFFDTLISPLQLSRTNTNIIYLMFKAISKGFEVINNVCVSLSNKFNPLYCSDEDLVSTAYLVGTERKAGAVSGLRVIAYNNTQQAIILPAGTYTYNYNSDITFNFTLQGDIEIAGEGNTEFVFLSEEVGSYAVTTQQSISVTSDQTIPSGITFACSDNDSLLGYDEETTLNFRKRMLADTDRQDIINELKLKIRNLPYVYDCEIIFNRDTSSTVYGTFTIPPYYMLIVISTAMYTEDIAKIIAESAIYPTVNVENESHQINYVDGVFADGYYPVYLNDFTAKEFTVTVTYKADADYISSSLAQQSMRNGLITAINTNVHKDAITTDELFSVLNGLNLPGVTIYSVQLQLSGNNVAYINCLKTEIAEITEVNFSEVV